VTLLEKLAILTSSLAFLAAALALLDSFMTVLNRRRINEVHLSLNSRLDELLAAEKAAAYTAGKAALAAEIIEKAAPIIAVPTAQKGIK